MFLGHVVNAAGKDFVVKGNTLKFKHWDAAGSGWANHVTVPFSMIANVAEPDYSESWAKAYSDGASDVSKLQTLRDALQQQLLAGSQCNASLPPFDPPPGWNSGGQRRSRAAHASGGGGGGGGHAGYAMTNLRHNPFALLGGDDFDTQSVESVRGCAYSVGIQGRCCGLKWLATSLDTLGV